MVLFGNIGFSEYKARDGKVYYNNNLVVKNLDVNNFKVLGNNYVTDDNKIFFMNLEMKRVDLPTLGSPTIPRVKLTGTNFITLIGAHPRQRPSTSDAPIWS